MNNVKSFFKTVLNKELDYLQGLLYNIGNSTRVSNENLLINQKQ